MPCHGPHTVSDLLLSIHLLQLFVTVIAVVELAERFSVSAPILRRERLPYMISEHSVLWYELKLDPFVVLLNYHTLQRCQRCFCKST